MKKILQAMDGVKAKAEVNSSDMKKFLRAVTEAELNQPEAAPATSTLEQDPNFIKYTQLMSKYDMLSAEMRPDSSGLGVEKGWSPEFEKEVNSLKAQADQLAGPNAQAWAQARKITPQQTQQQLATQLEETGMSRLLSIITEGKGPLNRATAAESIVMQHHAEKKKTITNPVLNVQEDAKPSMIGKYFKAVETELAEAETRSKDRARQLAERVIERIVPNADGSLPDPNINRLTGKPNPSAAEPAPTNVKPSGSTVDYGGATYNLVGVFGDGIRPRIGRGDKVIPAKAYVVGDKMYVLLDTTTQEGVAGPKNCWPGHRKVGTKPGTGKNAGKRVNDCEKIGEATSAAQQAAIAIAKKKAGKK